MTWTEFVKELTSIPGVRVTGESDILGTYAIVHIGNFRTDCFLLNTGNILDKYMAWHYIKLVRMLAAPI